MFRLPAILLLTVLPAAPAGAVSFFNPSFENLSATYVDDPGNDQMNSVAPEGWDILANSPDWFWGEGPAGLWNTPFGDHFALGAATGNTAGAYREGISQSVSDFIPGELYAVSFSHANGLYYSASSGTYQGEDSEGGWQLVVDGTPLGVALSTNDNSTAAPEHTADWQSSSLTFTATSSTHEIGFLAWAPGVGDQGPVPAFQFLDHASVAMIPEPSAALLLGIGGLLALRRARR